MALVYTYIKWYVWQETLRELWTFKGLSKLAYADSNISCLLNGRRHRIEEKHKNGNKIIHKFHDKSLGRYRKLIQTKAKPLGHIENNCKLYSVTKPDSSYSPLPPSPGCSFCCTDDQKPKIWLGVPNLVPRSHSLLHWKARGRSGYEIRACHITTVYMQRVLTIWLKNPVEVSKT